MTNLTAHQPAPATLGQLFWKNRQAWVGTRVTDTVRYSRRYLEDQDLDGELEAGVSYDVVEARAATPEEIAADREAREAALPLHERLSRRIRNTRPSTLRGQGEREDVWQTWSGGFQRLSVYPNGVIEHLTRDRSGHESSARLPLADLTDAERGLLGRLRAEYAAAQDAEDADTL